MNCELQPISTAPKTGRIKVYWPLIERYYISEFTKCGDMEGYPISIDALRAMSIPSSCIGVADHQFDASRLKNGLFFPHITHWFKCDEVG